MQVKTGIVKILKDYRLEPSKEAPEVQGIAKGTITAQPESGLFVNFIKDPLY